jgi:coenzyme F420-reducing hydrogenase beta subunit
MTAPRAADLPVGSVVADTTAAFIKVDTDTWHETFHESPVEERFIQITLDGGAQVLRVGDGSRHE